AAEDHRANTTTSIRHGLGSDCLQPSQPVDQIIGARTRVGQARTQVL
ncbi:MAG: hypothetical protein AVDCRST_MAG75-2762, partial [uncultured Propionibacteriaceae bacterium]